jgi:hypothetical protein
MLEIKRKLVALNNFFSTCCLQHPKHAKLQSVNLRKVDCMNVKVQGRGIANMKMYPEVRIVRAILCPCWRSLGHKVQRT